MAAALAVVAGVIAPARAETVAVLDTVIDGVPPEGRSRLESNLEEGLRGVGFSIVPTTEVRGRLAKHNAVAGCTFGPCLRGVGKALGVELVLVVRIVADGPSFSFVLTLLDTHTGAPVAQVSDACAVCTFDEAMGAATLAVVDLATRYRDKMDAEPAKVVGSATEKRRGTKKAAWWLTGAAVVAGGTAAYLLGARDDLDEVGWGAAGAAGGLLLGGVVMFALD
jgi:hypothetical protein